MQTVKSLLFVVLVVVPFKTFAAPSPKSQSPTKVDLKATDQDVTNKLNQLHKTIDALQETVNGLKGGYDQHAKENAEAMKKKFDKLSGVVTKLSTQNNQLYVENKKLKQEKLALVTKITKLEAELQKQAEELRNAGAGAWLQDKANDLKAFLEESGLEHFASPRFSPLIAGLVSNGVIVIPLAMTSLYLLRYVKQLTVIRVLLALNFFDLGFAIATVLSCGLLLGDSFEGLRHISEVNFMFIQLVLAAVFWSICVFLGVLIIQNRRSKAWRYALIELLIRFFVGLDYMKRVWSPVMAREDVSIAVPPVIYVLYLVAAVAAVKLTGLIAEASILGRKHVLENVSEGEALVQVIAKGDE